MAWDRGISRDDAMKALLKALEQAIEACANVGTFNPTLANFALRCLARVATQVGIEEIRS